MLSIKGRVENVFEAPRGTTKDGQQYGGDWRVQLFGPIPLKNGQTRMELITLSTRSPEVFKSKVGQEVRVPVGAYASGREVRYFLHEGALKGEG